MRGCSSWFLALRQRNETTADEGSRALVARRGPGKCALPTADDEVATIRLFAAAVNAARKRAT